MDLPAFIELLEEVGADVDHGAAGVLLREIADADRNGRRPEGGQEVTVSCGAMAVVAAIMAKKCSILFSTYSESNLSQSSRSFLTPTSFKRMMQVRTYIHTQSHIAVFIYP